MTNIKTPKTTTPKTQSPAKRELTKINLNKFADALAKVEVKEKRAKETIYKYPDTFSKSDINAEKGKKFRNSLRNKLKRFSNNIFVYTKQQDIEAIKKEVALFNAFYAEHYILNDFSFASLSNTKAEGKEKGFKTLLDIVKEINAAAPPAPKTPKARTTKK